MTVKGVAVLIGAHTSFLDHLLPLASLMDIPLFISDGWVKMAAELYYPEVKILSSEDPERALSPYNTLFYVEPSRLPHGGFNFGEWIYHSDAKSVYGLHGNSDKYRTIFWSERMADEEIVLLYGPHMVDFLKEKGVYSRIKKVILTGNYRRLYYEKHKSFFDAKAASFLFSSHRRKTIFYAPTYFDRNPENQDSSSFFEVAPFLLEKIPDDFQILVKLHPYYFRTYPDRVRELKERYSSDQVFFLNETPLIYPLLAKSDLYLGDFSSISYDFLAFDRPLFFFNHHQRDKASDRGVMHYLAGREILPSDYHNLFSLLDQKEENKSALRQKLYTYAFGSERREFEDLKEEILEALL